jgi:hypothetical protein
VVGCKSGPDGLPKSYHLNKDDIVDIVMLYCERSEQNIYIFSITKNKYQNSKFFEE